MNFHYSQAIDLLMSGTIDYKTIAVNLAKSNPELFVQLARTLDQAWYGEVISLVKELKYVEAIKLIRAKVGFGLKEAKDVTDVLRQRMVDLKMIEAPWGAWAPAVREIDLAHDQRALYHKLLTAAGI